MTLMNSAIRTQPADRGRDATPPDPEVRERARRRRFTAAYKLQILEEADACCRPGQLGALLRREGLYSSHVVDWRRQRSQGALAALAPQRRGRPPTLAAVTEVAHLRRENERLARELAVAETVIEIQKKVSALLGLTRPTDADGSIRSWTPPPRSPRRSALRPPAGPSASPAPGSTGTGGPE